MSGLRRLQPLILPKSAEKVNPGPSPQPLLLKVSQLRVNDKYQRQLSKDSSRMPMKIAKEFDWELYHLLVVSPLNEFDEFTVIIQKDLCMTTTHISYYTVDVEYEYEHTTRDEFGWVEGREPGNGDFRPSSDVVRIQAPDETYVKIWVEKRYSSSSYRNLKINKIKEEILHLDAIITVK